MITGYRAYPPRFEYLLPGGEGLFEQVSPVVGVLIWHSLIPGAEERMTLGSRRDLPVDCSRDHRNLYLLSSNGGAKPGGHVACEISNPALEHARPDVDPRIQVTGKSPSLPRFIFARYLQGLSVFHTAGNRDLDPPTVCTVPFLLQALVVQE